MIEMALKKDNKHDSEEAMFPALKSLVYPSQTPQQH